MGRGLQHPAGSGAVDFEYKAWCMNSYLPLRILDCVFCRFSLERKVIPKSLGFRSIKNVMWSIARLFVLSNLFTSTTKRWSAQIQSTSTIVALLLVHWQVPFGWWYDYSHLAIVTVIQHGNNSIRYPFWRRNKFVSSHLPLFCTNLTVLT